MFPKQIDLLGRNLTVPGTLLLVHIVLGVGLRRPVIAFQRIICLLKQLIDEHLVHFVFNQMLHSFIEIYAFLCSQKEVLEEIIEDVNLFILAFDVLQFLFQENLLILQNVLEEIRDFQVLLYKCGFPCFLRRWLNGLCSCCFLCVILHYKLVIFNQILNAFL